MKQPFLKEIILKKDLVSFSILFESYGATLENLLNLLKYFHENDFQEGIDIALLYSVKNKGLLKKILYYMEEIFLDLKKDEKTKESLFLEDILKNIINLDNLNISEIELLKELSLTFLLKEHFFMYELLKKSNIKKLSNNAIQIVTTNDLLSLNQSIENYKKWSQKNKIENF